MGHHVEAGLGLPHFHPSFGNKGPEVRGKRQRIDQ